MITKILLSILALGHCLSVFTQNKIELTFTAIDSAKYEQLDSIKVMNRTQGGDTVLYYPDTVLVLDYQVGISEINTGSKRFQVFQNYPNPVRNKTTISFYVPERDMVSLIVTDLLGRELIKTKRILDQGYHSYQFTPGNGNLFIFSAQWRERSSCIKILQTNSLSSNTNAIEYIGSENSSPELKTTKDIQSFLFNLGDDLLYIGYIDSLQSGMLDTPETSETYEFQFATNIPCPGTSTVEYKGKVYNTIQIFSQCWLKENLDVGVMIQGSEEMSDNGIIEKYCFQNYQYNCDVYGGLYQWDEIMQYTVEKGTQGICPPGWHIPSDEELKILEGSVDSQYHIGDSMWENNTNVGFDAGKNLKSRTNWNYGGNGVDLFGFTCLPPGYRGSNNLLFARQGVTAYFWTSTQSSEMYSWYHRIEFNSSRINRAHYGEKEIGFSARCLKD